MPIRKEMKSKYPPPKEWKKIREEILKRANNCCEECGILNGLWGCRDTTGYFWSWEEFSRGLVPDSAVFEKDGRPMKKGFRIVLTIAHVDQNPENNGTEGDRPNLKALCQLHHNRLDAQHRANGIKLRRRNKSAQITLI